jgi:hypothetical protein
MATSIAEAQRYLQMLYRARWALMEEGKATACQIRAMAHEYSTVSLSASRSSAGVWCNG